MERARSLTCGYMCRSAACLGVNSRGDFSLVTFVKYPLPHIAREFALVIPAGGGTAETTSTVFWLCSGLEQRRTSPSDTITRFRGCGLWESLHFCLGTEKHVRETERLLSLSLNGSLSTKKLFPATKLRVTSHFSDRM